MNHGASRYKQSQPSSSYKDKIVPSLYKNIPQIPPAHHAQNEYILLQSTAPTISNKS